MTNIKITATETGCHERWWVGLIFTQGVKLQCDEASAIIFTWIARVICGLRGGSHSFCKAFTLLDVYYLFLCPCYTVIIIL